MRKTNPVSAGQTYRENLYNDLRDEARGSSYLLPYQQDTPDLTLKVNPANVYFGTTLVEFAGGNSPSFTAPAEDPRIDILSLNSSGTLIRTAGAEAGSPTAPAVPAGNIPICSVYNRVGQTEILDEDDSSEGYILKDLRGFIKLARSGIQVFTSNGTWTNPGARLIKVIVIGGGGGTGGYYGSITMGGASAGGYAEKIIDVSELASQEVVVGARGLGGTGASVGNPSPPGNNGGDSSFGDVEASGGGSGSTPGVGSGGDINLSGEAGGRTHATVGGSMPNYGYGGGVQGDGSGKSAVGYGSGGGGFVSTGFGKDGGSGTAGIVIVEILE
jgi:hypothetical protein